MASARPAEPAANSVAESAASSLVEPAANSVAEPVASSPAEPAANNVAEPVANISPAPANPILLTAADVGRTIDRIAHQILERAGEEPVILVGLPTRGVYLAQRLSARLETFTGHQYPVGSLDITLYRDDLRRRAPRALAETRLPDDGIEDATVVLVDDVLYSGRTIRAALDALRDHGRPAVVQLAVLVDRGHRQLPIRADYVGKNIPTALGDEVAVRLVESDGVDAVELVRAR